MAEGGGRRRAPPEDLAAKIKKLLHGGRQGSFCGLHGGSKTVRFAVEVFGELCFEGVVEDVGGGVWVAGGWSHKAAV